MAILRRIKQSYPCHGSAGPPGHGCHSLGLYAPVLFGILHMTMSMSQYKCTVHAVFSYVHLYVHFQRTVHKNKDLLQKIKKCMSANVAHFNIVVCTLPPGHARYSSRKAVFLCLPVYSVGCMSHVAQSCPWHKSDEPPGHGCYGS